MTLEPLVNTSLMIEVIAEQMSQRLAAFEIHLTNHAQSVFDFDDVLDLFKGIARQQRQQRGIESQCDFAVALFER